MPGVTWLSASGRWRHGCEVDPDQVILGAEWLFGTGHADPEAARPFDFLDELDVEPALSWLPDCHAVRQAIGRPVAIVAGLECYHYETLAQLRWRMYERCGKGQRT